MTWYDTGYQRASFPDRIIGTTSDRITTNTLIAPRSLHLDNITYNLNGYKTRVSQINTLTFIPSTFSTIPIEGNYGLPATDNIPNQSPSSVPWTVGSNQLIQLNRFQQPSLNALGITTEGVYTINIETRTRENLFRPLSTIGHPNYTPNLIPITKGRTSSTDGNSSSRSFRWFTSPLGLQILGDTIKTDQYPWYANRCKESPCNSDGYLLKTTPENTSSALVTSIESDFGGTSKSGLPVFNDQGQLMCGPVPTVSHGPLLMTSEEYPQTDIEFFSGGTEILMKNRLNNPISIGPGAVNLGSEARAQEVRGRKVLVFYAPEPEQETWGRGTNSQARTSRFLKFTTNWEHPDYDVWIEFSGSANAVPEPTATYASEPYVVVIPAGQTVAYTKCPFSPSDNFLQPIPPANITSPQTTGLVNGGWTIQFAQWVFTSSTSGVINTFFSGGNHSISVEIMSYAP